MPHSCASHSTHHTWDAWLSGCVTTALLRVCLCPGRGATVRTHQPSARSARCFSICTLTAALRTDVYLWGGVGWMGQSACTTGLAVQQLLVGAFTNAGCGHSI